MKKKGINKGITVISVLVGLLLVSCICSAEVSISSITSENAGYCQGESVKLSFNVSIINEEGCCALNDVTLKIFDGSSLECNLPDSPGNYPGYNCGGYDIDVKLTAKYPDWLCQQYGGNNYYYYTVYWQIPCGWSAEEYTADVNVSSCGKTKARETIFNVNASYLSINSIVLNNTHPVKGDVINITINATMSLNGNLKASYTGTNISLTRVGSIWNGIINTSPLSGSYTMTVEANDTCNSMINTSNFFVFLPFDISAGDPVQLIKTADKSSCEKGEIITYKVSVANNGTQPLNLFINDTASEGLRFVGNVNVNCNCSEFNYNKIPWTFTTDPQKRALDWWVNLTNLPQNCKCDLITTAQVIGPLLVNNVTAISDNGTNAITHKSNVIVNFKQSAPPVTPPPKAGGSIPQMGSAIEPAEVVTEQKISTDIPDSIIPGRQCFNVKSLTKRFENTFEGEKLTGAVENNLSNATVMLSLPNETYTLLKTNKNGEVCFDFECGNYTVNISRENFGEYIKSFTVTYGKLYITPASLTEANTGESPAYVVADENKKPVKDAFVKIMLPTEKTLNFTTGPDGKVTFNTGIESGDYKIFAWKYCYENDTLSGTIKKPTVCSDGICEGSENCSNCEVDCGACPMIKLMIDCTRNVVTGEKIRCTVTDETGKSLQGASVALTDGRTAETDNNGKVEFTADSPGEIDASANKKGYAGSEKARVFVTEKECFLFNIQFLSICWYWWLIIILIIIIIALKLPALRKKKAD